MAVRDRSGTHLDVPTHPTLTGVNTPSPALWLAIAAALATIALTAVTFWLSYEALHDLAAGHHLTGPRAWAWPGCIDAFIIVGEVLILRASLLGRIDWLAVLLVALGSVGSIILNVVSVGAHVDHTTQVVAAVPPVAALLAFTALMRQIYRALTLTSAATEPDPDPEFWPPAEDDVEVEQQAPVMTQLAPVIPPPPALPPVVPQAQAAAPIVYSDPRCAAIRPLYSGGFRPGTRTMRDAIAAAGYEPGSDGTIRGALRAEVERHEPHLAGYPAEPFQLSSRTA